MTPAQTPLVAESMEVTQADREAAQFAVECVTDSPPKARPGFADLWEYDLSLAFARHRLAAYEAGRAEGVRAGLKQGADLAFGQTTKMTGDEATGFYEACDVIAGRLHELSAIRALSKEPTK